MPVRIMDANGYGRTSNVAKGIRYAVDNGADVINLSFLGSYSSDIYSALNYANSKNVLVAVAAGSGNAWMGAALMLAFWLGSVPLLAGLAGGAQRMLPALQRRFPLVLQVPCPLRRTASSTSPNDCR